MTEYSVAMTDPKKANMRGAQLGNGYFFVVMGLIFIGAGAVVHDWITLVLALPFGALILGHGLLVLWRIRRLPK